MGRGLGQHGHAPHAHAQAEIGFAIIANFASNSPSHITLGASSLKTAVWSRVFTLALVVGLVACCGYEAPNQDNNTGSGVKFRAFVSQNVSAVGGATAGLDVIDATLDRLVSGPGVAGGPSSKRTQISA